jgi:hypothetical protein
VDTYGKRFVEVLGRDRFVVRVGVPGQQVIDAVDGVFGDSFQHPPQVGFRIQSVRRKHWRKSRHRNHKRGHKNSRTNNTHLFTDGVAPECLLDKWNNDSNCNCIDCQPTSILFSTASAA